jgi:membrane fusion protein, multidrug efflux system
MKKYPALLIIITFFLGHACSRTDSGNNKRQTGKIAVEGFIVKQVPLENNITIPGSILPNEQIELRSELSGRIEKLNFIEGTFVRKGDLLVKVDDSELRAQLQKLDAQYDQAIADEQRKKQLIEVNGITQEEYDAAVTAVRGLEADISLIKTRISKSNIRAPFDGYVGLRMQSPGAYVTTGDIISTLVETNPAKIEFNVPERYVSGIHKGMIVTFNTSGDDTEYKGRVYANDPMIDLSSRSLKVRAVCENPQNKLVPGAFVELSLGLQKIDNALMVPTTALVPLLNSQNVYIVKNGTARLQEVTTGIRTENRVQITKGVQTGDTLALTGLLALRNGMPVSISEIVTHEIN